MRTRKVYLLKDDSFAAARTKTLDVNVADPIASIDVIVEMTNGSAMTEASVVKIHDEFTTIELVDGSDVICSASMEEWQGLNFVEMGRVPYMNMTLEDDAIQQEVCHINFGIGMNDNNHYLRPSDFTNLQMRIVNTFTTAAATSWAASGHVISIVANVIESGIGDYQGFLSTKAMYEYTAVSGAWETIDMPRDYPYRLIMIQSEKTAKTPYDNLTNLKLTCDADKYVPIEIDVDHLLFDNLSRFGMATIEYKKRMKSAADVCYSDLWYRASAAVAGGTTLYIPHVLSVTAEKVVAQTYAQT